MSFFKRLFGGVQHRDASPASRPQSHLASGMSQMPSQSPNGTRRELLRVVLRDTLNKHGIPSAWIGAEALGSTSSTGQRGIHWRLVVRHWDARLLTHGVAFQQALIQRVTAFDPLASEWLTGISWQFALADESNCPPMPDASVWTVPSAPAVAMVGAVAAAASVTEVHVPPAPVLSPEQLDSQQTLARSTESASDSHDAAAAARADLEALLAIRDADFQAHGASGTTQPVWLSTEPAALQ